MVRHLWIKIACLCLAMGCEKKQLELDAPGEISDELYVLSTVLWDPGAEIHVCWEDPGALASASDKNGMRRGALSWAAVANIRFVGWDDVCPGGGLGGGIHIKPNDGGAVNVSALGKPGPSVHNTLNMNLESDLAEEFDRCDGGTVSREDCIMIYSRHEWGHVLGFSHDNNRPDKDCPRSAQGQDGDTLVRGPDYYSVMSYCSSQDKLTLDDIYGVTLFYGMAPALQVILL